MAQTTYTCYTSCMLPHDLDSALDAMDALLGQRLQTPVALLSSCHHHIRQRPGKRIRARLVLCTYGLYGAWHEGIRMAALIELLHTATLLHDDVIDHAEARRKQASLNQTFGNTASILSGDYLYAIAFQLIAEFNDPYLTHVLSRATAKIVAGEMRQHHHQTTRETTYRHYLRILYGKTACLFETACHLAAYRQAPRRDVRHLTLYGRLLGMAYQLIDDAMDYQPHPSLGKPHGNDLQEGKQTGPWLAAYHQASPSIQADYFALLDDANQHPDLLHHIKTYGVQVTVDMATRYFQKSLTHLGALSCENALSTFSPIHQILSQRGLTSADPAQVATAQSNCHGIE